MEMVEAMMERIEIVQAEGAGGLDRVSGSVWIQEYRGPGSYTSRSSFFWPYTQHSEVSRARDQTLATAAIPPGSFTRHQSGNSFLLFSSHCLLLLCICDHRWFNNPPTAAESYISHVS